LGFAFAGVVLFRERLTDFVLVDLPRFVAFAT
jgi:hypothetical protein